MYLHVAACSLRQQYSRLAAADVSVALPRDRNCFADTVSVAAP
jgi:hypothetical protein